ncbi:MAG: hypothetical protein SFV18_17915 [Bryobacteraceae bacterium]|nr:hypothetical protein [Bryobacteraceae bacterium]
MIAPERQVEIVLDLWDAVRTCEMNVMFHRAKAARSARMEHRIEWIGGVLVAVAGVGILAGLSVPNAFWAALAFAGGTVTQARSIFRIPDAAALHRSLKDEYSSVLSLFKGVVGRAKDAGLLTDELYFQLQLVFERYRVVRERDDTDYETEEATVLRTKVMKLYPADGLWLPPTALQAMLEEEEQGNVQN